MKRELLMFICMAATFVGCGSASHSKVQKTDFQGVVNGRQADLYTLTNKNGVEITVSNFGGRVVELWVPDRNGVFADVVLGHESLDRYVNYTGERFLGATIGRYGNRIAKGRFTLDSVEYTLAINNGPNSLHGGLESFDMVVWDALQVDPQTLKLSLVSPDGDQGYPGTLNVEMTYQLTDDNSFVITHRATTDKRTVLNLTHHSFFNLKGAGEGTINDHVVTINADSFVPVDSTLIPLGVLASVDGTPMDFRTPMVIGERSDNDFEQLKFAAGYDHCWVLNRKSASDLELAATVYEPTSGRVMEVSTTEPGIQFYAGNFFDGKEIGKHGKTYAYRGSLALETQHFPDSPNQPSFPSTILEPGQEYLHVCAYKFSTRD